MAALVRCPHPQLCHVNAHEQGSQSHLDCKTIDLSTPISTLNVQQSTSSARSDFISGNTHDFLVSEPPQTRPTTDFCHEISEWLMDNVDVETPLLATIHGSYLYGTAHEKSDIDLFVVSEGGKNGSKVTNGYDVQILNFDTFMRLLEDGSHQSVEAFYSPYRVLNENHHYFHLLKNFTPNMVSFINKCTSAAKSFEGRAHERDSEDPAAKKLYNHSQRLYANADKVSSNSYSPVVKSLPSDEEYYTSRNI